MNNGLNQKQYPCALLLPESKQRNVNTLPVKNAGKRTAAHKLVAEGKRARQTICVLLLVLLAILAIVFQGN
jgi:hypothetical protein